MDARSATDQPSALAFCPIGEAVLAFAAQRVVRIRDAVDAGEGHSETDTCVDVAERLQLAAAAHPSARKRLDVDTEAGRFSLCVDGVVIVERPTEAVLPLPALLSGLRHWGITSMVRFRGGYAFLVDPAKMCLCDTTKEGP